MQYDFLTRFGADVKYMVGPTEYHSMPSSVPRTMLQYVYGQRDKQYFKLEDKDWEKNGVIVKFDQGEFVDPKEWDQSQLAQHGYMYYPKECINEKCAIQFVLHGCPPNAEL